jgi:2-aminoadipate transaminase
MDYSQIFSQSTRNQGSSMIRELVASTRGIEGLISFAGGFPSPKTFPCQELSDLYAQVVKNEGCEVLQYGASEGDPIFKQALINYEAKANLKQSEIITSVGSTNAIYAYAKCFIDQGDYVICEAPSFLGTVVAFEALGANLHGVEVEDDGMNMEQLELDIQKLIAENKKIKFIYTIPEFQNPTGVTMSREKRDKLIELALLYDIPILEDNPYGELRYTGNKIDSIFEIARMQGKNIVTSVKSFSKVLGPGMRSAYMMGDEIIIAKVALWLQKIIVSSDCVTQRVVARLLEKGMLAKQIQKISDIYQPSLEAMLNALEKHMPKSLKWTKPEGGMFIWITLPEGMSGDQLFEDAKAEKVCFIPGSKFYPKGQEKYNAIRLNFTFADPDTIEEGVKRLAKLFK